MRYQQEGMILVEGLQNLVYCNFDLIQEEVSEEEFAEDDVGVTEAFDAW